MCCNNYIGWLVSYKQLRYYDHDVGCHGVKPVKLPYVVPDNN